jgi:hypothetical protein
MQAFPKELGLIDAIHSYTSLPPSGSGAKGEGMTGSRKVRPDIILSLLLPLYRAASRCYVSTCYAAACGVAVVLGGGPRALGDTPEAGPSHGGRSRHLWGNRHRKSIWLRIVIVCLQTIVYQAAALPALHLEGQARHPRGPPDAWQRGTQQGARGEILIPMYMTDHLGRCMFTQW